MPNNLENKWNFICKIITNGNWDFTFKMSFWFLILNFFSYKLCSVYVIGSFVVCSFCHKCNPFIIQEFFFFSISYHYYFSSLSWFLYYGFKLKLHSIVLSKNILTLISGWFLEDLSQLVDHWVHRHLSGCVHNIARAGHQQLLHLHRKVPARRIHSG